MQENVSALVSNAVETLKKGEVIGFPTETVYGLAAAISNESAIRKIFSIKQRPFFDPLIVHVSSVEQARSLTTDWPLSAQRLAEHFWPGPLTLVLPKKAIVSDLITSGLDSVALRFPKHPLARRVIESLGEPVAAPSANKFGRTSPSQAQHVRDELGEAILVLDGGACEVGIESTIIKLNETESLIEITLLRAGVLTPEQIKKALSGIPKMVSFIAPDPDVVTPGRVKHHYMPPVPVLFIEKSSWDPLQGSLLAINQKLNTKFTHPCLLSLSSVPDQAARELYGRLRQCSLAPYDVIVFIKESYHQGEAWEAILDRLQRASRYHWDV